MFSPAQTQLSRLTTFAWPWLVLASFAGVIANAQFNFSDTDYEALGIAISLYLPYVLIVMIPLALALICLGKIFPLSLPAQWGMFAIAMLIAFACGARFPPLVIL